MRLSQAFGFNMENYLFRILSEKGNIKVSDRQDIERADTNISIAIHSGDNAELRAAKTAANMLLDAEPQLRTEAHDLSFDFVRSRPGPDLIVLDQPGTGYHFSVEIRTGFANAWAERTESVLFDGDYEQLYSSYCQRLDAISGNPDLQAVFRPVFDEMAGQLRSSLSSPGACRDLVSKLARIYNDSYFFYVLPDKHTVSMECRNWTGRLGRKSPDVPLNTKIRYPERLYEMKQRISLRKGLMPTWSLIFDNGWTLSLRYRAIKKKNGFMISRILSVPNPPTGVTIMKKEF